MCDAETKRLDYNAAYDQGESDAIALKPFEPNSLSQNYIDGYSAGYQSVKPRRATKANRKPRVDAHSFSNMQPGDYLPCFFHDCNPAPGSFVRTDGRGPQPLTVSGDDGTERTVQALTWSHAEFMFARQLKCVEGVGPYAEDLQKCDCCGQILRYVFIFKHTPSGGFIGVGSDCAKRFGLASRQELEALKLFKYRRDLKGDFRRYLEQHPGMLVIFSVEGDLVINDIARKARESGSPSEKQAAYAAQRAIWSVERGLKPVEPACTTPVPAGDKVLIRGVVVSKKWRESDFGGSIKAVIRDERGFKVWGTVPGRIDCEVGDTIEFVAATVTKSNDDETFGFYSRASKAKVITRAKGEAVA